MTVDFETLAKFANTLTVAVLLVVVIYGGLRQWWVYGWLYKEAKRDAQEWKALALRGTGIAERLIEKTNGNGKT